MRKTFKLTAITLALMAGNVYAAQVVEGPFGTGTGANTVTGTNSVAVGEFNVVSNDSTAIGYANRATGQNSFVAGSRSNTGATNGSVAMGGDGSGLLVQGDNSVALGGNSITDKQGSVSVGGSIHTYGENATSVGSRNQVVGDQSTSFGDGAWTGGNHSTAIGSETWANAKDATMLGYNAQTGANGTVVIGSQTTNNNAAASENAIVLGANSIANVGTSSTLGSYTIANESNSVALGYRSDVYDLIPNSNGVVTVGTVEGTLDSNGTQTRRVTQVEAGINDQDAVNLSQLTSAIENVGVTQEFKDGLEERFTQQTEDRQAADDAEVQARKASDATLQANIDDEAAKRIAGDAAEAAARTNAINNEAQARISGDAAEAQARSNADIALGQRINVQTATRVAEVSRLDGRIDQASRRLDDIEKNAYRGVAIALAAQQAIPNIRPGQIALFAGVGHYEGETAGSVGVATSFISNRISLSGAVGFAGGNEVGSRIGLTYLW